MRTWPALHIQQADDDDLVHAFLIDFNLAAIEDSRFFFQTVADRDRAEAAVRAYFPGIDVRSLDVADDDWAAKSQAALRAIAVGALTVAPPWDVPAGSDSSQTIVIEPSMGFGTGHHATTRLCLAAMQQMELRGRSVIDVGTGSGILAIAARRLGASGVLAMDDDPDAIAAAEANVAMNRESRIALELGDFRASKIGQFDVVVANLTGGLLIAAADRIQSFAVPGGRLVVSGFLEQEEHDVLGAFHACNVESRSHEDGWTCATLLVRTLSTS